MSRELTPKQQAFIAAYLETGNATDAYKRSYDAGNMKEAVIRVKASELLKSGNVAVTIENARAKVQKKHEITVDRLTDLLELALQKAMAEPKGASAAVSAVLGIGKLHGLVVDKKEVTRKRDATDLSESELLAIAAMGGPGAAAEALRENGADRIH